MLSQNTSANPLEFASPVHLTSALFDLGDCFGNLCRLPLQSAIKLFGSHASDNSHEPAYGSTQQTLSAAPSRFLAQHVNTNIPFAVSREWQNRVWSYQLSLHPEHNADANQTLHRHLSARSLSSIPTEQKGNLQEWLYFASPLKRLTQLDWQLLTEQEQKRRRLQNRAHWFRQKLEQGSLIGDLLLIPFTDLPLGGGLNRKPIHSFTCLGKLALPNQQKLGALNFAIFRQGVLDEGYGLQPVKLFRACDQLRNQPLASEYHSLLLLDHKQCLENLHRLETALSGELKP